MASCGHKTFGSKRIRMVTRAGEPQIMAAWIPTREAIHKITAIPPGKRIVRRQIKKMEQKKKVTSDRADHELIQLEKKKKATGRKEDVGQCRRREARTVGTGGGRRLAGVWLHVCFFLCPSLSAEWVCH